MLQSLALHRNDGSFVIASLRSDTRRARRLPADIHGDCFSRWRYLLLTQAVAM